MRHCEDSMAKLRELQMSRRRGASRDVSPQGNDEIVAFQKIQAAGNSHKKKKLQNRRLIGF